MQAGRLSSSVAPLPDDAIVNHVTTRQGRDHIVSYRAGENVMVIVNVSFEPDLSTRELQESLRLISLRWPRSPEALGVLIGDLNICYPEEGRFSFVNQAFFTTAEMWIIP